MKTQNYTGPVFARGNGELGYRQPQLEVGEELYFHNFTTVDFTYWPDKKTYDALDFVPEGAISLKFIVVDQREWW